MKIKSVVFCGSAVTPKQYPKGERPEIAFIGRSNVGKSSLINCLINRRNLARISQTPGKTQLINFFLVNDHFFFTDLPGFGYARVPKTVRRKWQEMIETYFFTCPTLKGVCWLFDIRREPTDLDWQTINWLTASKIPFRLVITKADKFSRSKAKTKSQKLAASLSISNYQTFSVVDRSGKEELWRWIKELVAD